LASARRDVAPLPGFLGPFVSELRASGLLISTPEVLDATRALEAVGLTEREVVRAALAATLAKSAVARGVFDSVFDLFFPDPLGSVDSDDSDDKEALCEGRLGVGDEAGSASALGGAIVGAAEAGDLRRLAKLARVAVSAHGGLEPGRRVAGTYALWRTSARLGLDGVVDGPRLARGDDQDDGTDADLLRRWRARERAQVTRDRVGRALEAEIRRQLRADLGAEALASTLRRPLLEDVDLLTASAAQLAELRRALQPLARHLAARLGRPSRAKRGRIDGSRTLRRALATGGLPIDPRWVRPRPTKPKLWVLADVSGSVASFSRFTLGLVQALERSFAQVRTFVFVDAPDEVTASLRRVRAGTASWAALARDAPGVRGDGHSDYGSVLVELAARYASELDRRTTVVILGDARTNYHPARADALALLGAKARSVLWLNPERQAYWGSGDSVMDEYAPCCDEVFECRTLRQLRAVVGALR